MAYPTGKADKNIIIHGTPLFFALGCRYDDTVIDVAASDPEAAVADPDVRLLLDNIKTAKLAFSLKSEAANASEYIDIVGADGHITRFPKYTLIVDGTDDTQTLTEASNDENATGAAKMTVTLNQGDLDSASWTALLNKILTYKDNYWFCILPIGFNYNKRYVAATRKADGFAYMLGKLDNANDIELTIDSNPQSIDLVFVSYKFYSSSTAYPTSTAAIETLYQNAFSASVTGMQLRGTSPAVTITPETLTTDEAEDVGYGKLVLKPVS